MKFMAKCVSMKFLMMNLLVLNLVSYLRKEIGLIIFILPLIISFLSFKTFNYQYVKKVNQLTLLFYPSSENIQIQQHTFK